MARAGKDTARRRVWGNPAHYPPPEARLYPAPARAHVDPERASTQPARVDLCPVRVTGACGPQPMAIRTRTSPGRSTATLLVALRQQKVGEARYIRSELRRHLRHAVFSGRGGVAGLDQGLEGVDRLNRLHVSNVSTWCKYGGVAEADCGCCARTLTQASYCCPRRVTRPVGRHWAPPPDRSVESCRIRIRGAGSALTNIDGGSYGISRGRDVGVRRTFSNSFDQRALQVGGFLMVPWFLMGWGTDK